MLVLTLIALSVFSALAAQPGNDAFQRTWQRTDKPVLDGTTARTWMWGPEASTNLLQEPYAEAPDGMRDVQYFDKSRMEITQPAGDPASIWYVTNGLLVVELITGNMQTGDATFEQRFSAQVNVAGDTDDPTGPTYQTFTDLLDAAPLASGTTISQRVDRAGVVTDDPALAIQSVGVATIDDVTNHAIAEPFWTLMNSSGAVYEDGQTVEALLFENPYFAMGRPITEAYWANVKVAGTYRDVLMQCFERRCLTYTPGNPEGFIVEAGNVGQHYYAWRYNQQPGNETPVATVSASATSSVAATVTTTAMATVSETMAPTMTATQAATATVTETLITDYAYQLEWGTPYTVFTPMLWPNGVAEDNNNHIWVMDSKNNRLLAYDENGVFLRSVGSEGQDSGQFQFPKDAAFGDEGQMYVVDQNNHRIQIFNTEGLYLAQWGAKGTGDGQFDSPTSTAIHDNVVYVVDNGNDRIQLFDLNGVYQSQFGSQGNLSGQFQAPNSLAFDPQGNLYVVDTFNHRVQKFTSSGSFISQFGSFGSGNGEFGYPLGIDIDEDGFIYIADQQNNRIQKFDPDGVYVAQWGSEGTGFGQFKTPGGIDVDHDGNVYVAGNQDNRVQKFTADGVFLFELYDGSRGQFGNVSDITLDQNGNLLTVDDNKVAYDAGSVSRYTPNGIPLDVLSRTRPDTSQYDQLAGVAVNLTSGDIYVINSFSDSYTHSVQRFTSTWQYLGQWGTTGTGLGEFNGASAIDIDDDGYVYIADTMNNRVQKFDANGVFLDQWGGVGSGNGQFKQPTGIVVDGERVYVSDYGNNRVEVFDRDGTYLSQWGSLGSGIGNLNGPAGLAVTPQGLVLVVDYANNRVQIFSPDGEALNSFGSLGSGPGQFNVPWGIEVDGAGNVYVTDISNHRVQKFSPAG